MKRIQIDLQDSYLAKLEARAAKTRSHLKGLCELAVEHYVDNAYGSIPVAKGRLTAIDRKQEAIEHLIALTSLEEIRANLAYASLPAAAKQSVREAWHNTSHGRMHGLQEAIRKAQFDMSEANPERQHVSYDEATKQSIASKAQEIMAIRGGAPVVPVLTAVVKPIEQCATRAELVYHPQWDELSEEAQDALYDRFD